MAVDSAGNVYLSDLRDHRVRRISTAGVVTTVAGTGLAGFSGDRGPAAQAQLNSPRGLVLDGKGSLYIADYNNNRIRKVVLSTGIITTIAGGDDFRARGDGGPAANAQFDPYDLAMDSSGDIYIADYSNDRVRKIDMTSGNISTIAGTGVSGFGGDNSPAIAATLDGPISVAVDSAKNVYIADLFNSRVRVVTAATGLISAYAGTGNLFDPLGDNGPAVRANVPFPTGVRVDSGGNVFIITNNVVREVLASTKVIMAYAGDGSLAFGGDGGQATFAKMVPRDVAFLPSGAALITDLAGYRIRRVSGGVISTFAGTSTQDGQQAANTLLNLPNFAVSDGRGGIVFSDGGNQRVRRINADGTVTTLAGTGVTGSASGRIDTPYGVGLDAQGSVYFADTNNHRILRITPGGSPVVIAGNGDPGFAGDKGPALQAQFNTPRGVAVDASGNVYVADSGNGRIRRIGTDNIIDTIAGTGTPASSGDNGPAASASLIPYGLAVDSAGNLFVSDSINNRVRRIGASDKIITTVAGVGTPGSAGDGGPATAAQLNAPRGVAVEPSGAILIADYFNQTVRRIVNGTITTIAGNGGIFVDNETGAALGAAIDPFGVAVDQNGQILIVDKLNDRIRRLTVLTPRALSVVSGSGQAGVSGARLRIAAKVADASGIGVAGVPVAFAVTAGTATISPGTVTSGGDGTAATLVTLGDTPGQVTVTASASGLASVTFQLTINPPPVTTPVPQINPGQVYSAGLSLPPLRRLAPGGIGSVFGKNFLLSGAGRKVRADDLVNGSSPTVFLGVCILFGTVRAPIQGVYPTQVNFQTPALPDADAQPVRVVTNCGTSGQLQSDPETVAIRAVTPEFFYWVSNASGKSPIIAQDAQSGAFLAAAGLIPGVNFTPAKPDGYVTMWFTGGGATNPALNPGDFPAGTEALTGTVAVKIGGKDLPPGNILYAGIAAQSPGGYILVIQLPGDTPDGDLSVDLTINGVSTPAGGYLTVLR